MYKQMKIGELLLFFAEIKGRTGSPVKASMEKWLNRFELWDKRDKKIEELSKGNQQKVQLIASLLHDPDILILDEPMSGLDPVNVVLVRGLLRELRDEGRTILLSTHMMHEAERLADDIVLIHQGEIVLSGALDQVRRSYGRNTVQIDFDGDGHFLESLPGVAKGTIVDNSAELSLAVGTDPQSLLESAIGRLRIRRFELASPSLEEIFIDKVGDDTLAQSEVAQ